LFLGGFGSSRVIQMPVREPNGFDFDPQFFGGGFDLFDFSAWVNHHGSFGLIVVNDGTILLIFGNGDDCDL
jgi:hypothetical protein